ncbi:MAG: ABC transporter permease [Anaerolineales bacterium]|nr:MAG: ABC transporter permease [Anaerolineales bacterium]
MNVPLHVRIQKRLAVPRWLELSTATFSLLLALAVIAVVFRALGVDPIVAYRKIFRGAFGSLYGLSETTVKAIPLILAGVGLCVAFRARVYNIGAEGQLLIGAICGTGLALAFPDLPAWLLLPGMFFVGFAGGALWASVPALLKARFHVDEVLSSLMMVYIASELVNYLVYGPWKGLSEMGFPYTDKFSPSAQLPRLFRTRIHYPTLILGLAVAAVAYVLIHRTKWGFEIRVTGENPEAARYAGMDYLKTALLVMVFSGGLAGLAGVGEVAGIHYRLRYPQGVSPGYGFTAIIVAWLAHLNPLAVIVTALLIGGLLVGGDAIQVALGLPVATIHLFNGVILLFVLGGELFTRYRIRLEWRQE